LKLQGRGKLTLIITTNILGFYKTPLQTQSMRMPNLLQKIESSLCSSVARCWLKI